MLRKLSFIAAILVLTASWVSAGNLGALATAAASQAPTPLYVKHGALVKAEYKSGLMTTADEDVSATGIQPERVAASADQKIMARPAIAFKPRPSGMMAPPPRVESVGNGQAGLVAEAKQDSLDLEGDLEKDLVLSPPPQKAEETKEVPAKPVATESRPAPEKTAVVASPKKAVKKPIAKKITKVHPVPRYAGSPKPIHKVRPVSQNSWQFPAGAYENRPFPQTQTVYAPSNFGAPNVTPNRMSPPSYATSDPRPTFGAQRSSDRIVRDGVTIKLAPATAPVTAPLPYESDQRDDSSGSDLLSTAAEIIGMPFAFISSLF
ncbi:MAG: hypothetical protein M0T73_00115 [Deltaproteobacteria bacterium]|nr:hypothetical protein [Deltaproteobacteria bacterium]